MICAAGGDFFESFCVVPRFFCQEILAWASPDPYRVGVCGEGGGVSQPLPSQQPFPSLFSFFQPFPARRLDPPGGR